MLTRHRDRWFAALSGICMRHPKPVLSVAAVVVIGAALLIPGIQVTTSRYGLVAPDNPYQARLLAFFERFGFPDNPVIVVSGADGSERRRVVDALVARLEALPEFRGRVLAQVDPEKLAEVLLLTYPDAMREAATLMAADGGLGPVLRGGLTPALAALNRQLELAAATDQLQMLSPLAVLGGPSASDDGIRWLTAIAGSLDAMLTGAPPWSPLMRAAGPRTDGLHEGIDAQGYLVGIRGQHHLIAVLADLPGDEVHQLRPVVDRIRALRDETLRDLQPAGVTAAVSGLPALAVDEQDAITLGLMQSSVATVLGILFLFFLVFRSMRQTIVALIPLAAGVVLTVATAHLLFGELNLITAGFIAILLGLGIDFGVHAVARYNEYLRGGTTPERAVLGTLQRAGPGILTGAVTTALAFLTTATTEFTAFAELGVLTAVGLFYILVATFFLLPPLLVWGSRSKMPVAPELPGAAALVHATRHGRAWMLGAGILLALFSAASLSRLAFNVRYFDFLPSETESAGALQELEEDGAMAPNFATASAESVEEARAMTERLRAMASVARVQSATDLMPRLTEARLTAVSDGLSSVEPAPDFTALASKTPVGSEVVAQLERTLATLAPMRRTRELTGRPTDGADAATAAVRTLRDRIAALPADGSEPLRGINARFAGILQRAWGTAQRVVENGAWRPSDLPPLFQKQFASYDREALALYIFPAGSPWDPVEAARFRSDVEAVDPSAAGSAISLHEHSRMILKGFERAAILAALLVFLMLLLDFRSLGDAALALIPVAFGWLWMLGTMATIGLRFDFANIVALPLVLGIGIDAGVHLMHRCRESEIAHAGAARLEDILRGTGAAVFVAAVTTMIGFAGLMAADYGAMVSLGLVMILGIGCCLLAALFILPAVLLLLGRSR